MAFKEHWLGQYLAQFFCHVTYLADHGRAFTLKARNQHNKLVATEARHSVFLTHARLQARGDQLEHGIANGMAQGVVDVLEVINLPLESRDLVFSHLQSDSSIVLNVAEFFASKELLVVHLGQLILALHMRVVELLKVLDLSI
jgi:hypothetical protein